MADFKKSALELIGNTPLLEAVNYGRKCGLAATLFLKLEYLNPAGSVKDRAALYMIEDAEKRGILKPPATIIEPTSGNTGIGLASIGAMKGYKVILTMPETMSVERRMLLAAYGAEIVLTEGAKGMAGAIEKAEELKANTPGAVILGQFTNSANVQAHYETTGPEIWKSLDGKVDMFVAGVGTGGTITGTGKFLKSQNSEIQVVAVEPAASPLLSGGKAGSHGIQGIGANFIPEILDRSVYDRVIQAREQDAYQAARQLAATEGILVGISSGAALWAASEEAKKPEYAGKNIVVLLPDTGDRYLSTPLFAAENK